MRPLLLCLLLLPGCLQKTGLCERSDDCPEGQACEQATHLCADPSPADALQETPGDLDQDPGDLLGALLLQVERVGDGTGAVRSDPAGIDCGTRCGAGFPPGSKLRLTAEPLAGSVFEGWSQGCSGTGPCDLTLSAPLKLRASFRQLNWVPVASGTTHGLRAVFGALPPGRPPGGAVAWAVGDKGTILRWDGARWGPEDSKTTAPLRALWGSSATELWAVGEGAPDRGTGAAWTPQPGVFLQAMSAVWGAATRDVWSAGDGGALLRWDGSTWSGYPGEGSADLYALWGVGASYVWTVGDKGTIQRWDGAAWSARASGTTLALRGVWSAAATAAWAVGDRGVILRWNGNRWAAEASPVVDPSLRAIYGFQSGGQAKEMWAVGDRGTIIRWDGTGWSTQRSGTTADLYGVWGERPGDLWAVGASGTILRLGPPP